MKIKGIVTLVFRDKDTGEVVDTVEQENHIQLYYYNLLMASNLGSYNGAYTIPNKIVIGTQDGAGIQRNNIYWWYDPNGAMGVDIPGQTNPIFLYTFLRVL